MAVDGDLELRRQAVETCVVCGEPVDETNSAECHGCNRRYHLVLKEGEQGKDCGEVWVDDWSASLQFACSGCLKEAGADPAPPAAGAAASDPGRPPQLRRARRLDVPAPPNRARRARGQRRYRKR